MGSGGPSGGSSTSTTEASIAPELRGLFSSTARIVQGAQATVPQVQGPGFSFGLVPQVGGGFNPAQFNVSAGTGFTTQPQLFQQLPPSTSTGFPAASTSGGFTPQDLDKLKSAGFFGEDVQFGGSTVGGGVGADNIVGPTGQATPAFSGGNSILTEFLSQNPQIIPQTTAGQQDIINRQRERLEGPIITGQEQFAQNLARGFGGIRGPEQNALNIAGTLGDIQPAEQEAIQLGRGFGDLRGSEIGALNLASGFGNLRFPEFASLAQINELTGGPLGSSPATQAAIEAVRAPVLNELALAGLGTSGAVGESLGGAFAPILAQEQALRAQLAPVLAGIGDAQRRGDVNAAAVFQRAGEAQRAGDIQQADNLIAIGNAARQGSAQAAQINQQIGAALRAGDIESANFLAAQGKELVDRETGFLADLGTSEEAQRALIAQQFESEQRDFLRRNAQSLGLTTGVLGGFPSTLGSQTVTEQSGAGK